MDRDEFIAWLILMGFSHHPVNHTTWLKTTDGFTIKLWIYDNDNEPKVRIRHKGVGRRMYKEGTHHRTFVAARNHLVNNLLRGGAA